MEHTILGHLSDYSPFKFFQILSLSLVPFVFCILVGEENSNRINVSHLKVQ